MKLWSKNNREEKPSSQFVGVTQLAKEHEAGLQLFREWAAAGEWEKFHQHNYDWWMFPYDQSSSLGYTYTVYEAEINKLLEIPDFKTNHAEAARLLLMSWGWDSETESIIAEPAPAQAWAHHPIRLFKRAESMEQFGITDMHRACLDFAHFLNTQKLSFEYLDGRNLYEELGIEE